MRIRTLAGAALAAVLLCVPVVAAIKALTLRELMQITDDVVHGTITAKDSVAIPYPTAHSVYTRVTLRGTSLRTGEEVTLEAVFHGSHDPDDGFVVSEMPTLQDARLGGEVVAFVKHRDELGGRAEIFNWGALYRVERGFGEAVVIGKGEGGAFAKNTKLTGVREQVATTHAALAQAALDSSLTK